MSENKTPYECEANARLIAAAPEMAELLEAIWCDEEARLSGDAYPRIRALLDRIHGGSNDPHP